MIGAVDLFCGAGGLTAGLRNAGIDVFAGYDNDSSCKYPFEYNNRAKFIAKDVAKVSGSEISSWLSCSPVRLLAGCAPCQPFSTYNQGRDMRQDRKWPLLHQFSRLISEVLPDLVTKENVPEVIKHEVYHDFLKDLQMLGYHISASRVYCAEYGLPQNRKRHVLLASRLGEIALIPATHKYTPTTVREAIGGLPTLKAGEVDFEDELHKAQGMSSINAQRIKASKPGGNWRDWPEELLSECHKRLSGKTYPSVYGRMEWDQPSPTMTTLCYGFGNGRFGHPEQDRAISLREAAVLQSFPRHYRFVPPGERVTFKGVGRMIGNAVPVRLGEVIGISLREHVERTLQLEFSN